MLHKEKKSGGTKIFVIFLVLLFASVQMGVSGKDKFKRKIVIFKSSFHKEIDQVKLLSLKNVGKLKSVRIVNGIVIEFQKKYEKKIEKELKKKKQIALI